MCPVPLQNQTEILMMSYGDFLSKIAKTSSSAKWPCRGLSIVDSRYKIYCKWPCLRYGFCLCGRRQSIWRDSVPSLISYLLRILVQQFRSISWSAKNPGSASEFAAKRPCLQHGLCLFDIRFNITAKWPCLLRGLCLFSSSLRIQRLSTHEFPSNSKPQLQRLKQYILDSVTIAKWPCHGPSRALSIWPLKSYSSLSSETVSANILGNHPVLRQWLLWNSTTNPGYVCRVPASNRNWIVFHNIS